MSEVVTKIKMFLGDSTIEDDVNKWLFAAQRYDAFKLREIKHSNTNLDISVMIVYVLDLRSEFMT
jgi:hypothetical protein